MTRYSRTAALLHWAIAGLVLANIAIGLRMTGLKGMAQFTQFQLHKSLGITILLLTLIRIVWRVMNRPPPLATTLTPFERKAASGVHVLFYLALVGLPLTGWALVSASRYNIPTVLFGKIPWPHIGPVHAASTASRVRIEGAAGNIHEILAWAMISLAAVHIAAALKHQFFDRDRTLSRMLPFSNIGGEVS